MYVRVCACVCVGMRVCLDIYNIIQNTKYSLCF